MWELGDYLSLPVQGVHSYKESVVFKDPLILTLPVSGLHIELDELDDEATPSFTPVALFFLKKDQGVNLFRVMILE